MKYDKLFVSCNKFGLSLTTGSAAKFGLSLTTRSAASFGCLVPPLLASRVRDGFLFHCEMFSPPIRWNVRLLGELIWRIEERLGESLEL